jgi:aminoglycoside phosphotransferase (APT) family kinase protein
MVEYTTLELWYDCGCMNISQLLIYINARHATAFELAGKLKGGNQDGAYVLAEPDGRRAVLKQLFAPRALPIIHRLRAIGYPTPDLLYTGTAGDGTTYLVQEFVPGTPIATLTDAYLDQLFALNNLQANLNPQPQANPLESWSGYVYEAVFARTSLLAKAMDDHLPATADLLAALRRATDRYTATVLPNTDVVHGDLHNGNIVAEHGQITGVIDMVYAGYGTRAIDLATMLHTSDSDGYAPAARTRLRTHIIEHFGPDVYAICMAYRVIVTVAWAIRQGRPDWIDYFVQAGWAVYDQLA